MSDYRRFTFSSSRGGYPYLHVGGGNMFCVWHILCQHYFISHVFGCPGPGVLGFFIQAFNLSIGILGCPVLGGYHGGDAPLTRFFFGSVLTLKFDANVPTCISLSIFVLIRSKILTIMLVDSDDLGGGGPHWIQEYRSLPPHVEENQTWFFRWRPGLTKYSVL